MTDEAGDGFEGDEVEGQEPIGVSEDGEPVYATDEPREFLSWHIEPDAEDSSLS